MQLSKVQEEAVNAIYGQIMLVSCPGSGKTTIIVNRAVNMVNQGISPDNMLNITFTKAAADEMGSRFNKLSNKHVEFSTIHSFCFKLLRQKYGYSINDILKQSDEWIFVAKHLQNAVKDISTQLEDMTKEVINGISFCKNRSILPILFEPEKCDKDLFVEIFNNYERYKKQIKKIDFDDMVILFRDKLRIDKTFLSWCRNQYKFITIDEFQDVNQIQADIFYDICGDNGNIFIVGDDDQSIYGFRAAMSKIMLDFPTKFPHCKRIDIDTNYRSGKDIVKIAGRLIQNNKVRYNKDFKASRDIDGNIYLIKAEDNLNQADKVIEECKSINKSGQKYEDIAILFRTNNLAIPFVSRLIKEKIPFNLTENISGMHESPIFSDIIAYYRLANGKEQKGDLQRILNRPSRYLKADAFKGCSFNKDQIIRCATSSNEFAREKAKDMVWDIKALKGRKPADFMRSLNLGIGYREWLKDYATFINKKPEELRELFDTFAKEASQFETMEDWLKYAKLYEMKIREAAKNSCKEGICLSTFHGSKGLEWKNVFVTTVNKDTCPYVKATSEESLEEERRMFYVAITRAKDDLYLSYVDNGRAIPSQYLKEMGITK